MAKLEREIAPPSAFLLAMEPRGFFSVAQLIAGAPFLVTARRGAPHAVIVLPGLGATDRSTIAIRRYLRFLGYQATGWNRGRDIRPAGADVPAVAAQIHSLRDATGIPVSLVGWSRGGIIAREAARLSPDAARMVVTLGSPFAAPGASNVGVVWRRLTGEAFPAETQERMRALGAPLSMGRPKTGDREALASAPVDVSRRTTMFYAKKAGASPLLAAAAEAGKIAVNHAALLAQLAPVSGFARSRGRGGTARARRAARWSCSAFPHLRLAPSSSPRCAKRTRR